MSRWIRGVSCALLALAAWSGAAPVAAADKPALVPAEAFFKPTELTGAQLSPSGRYLAALRGGVAERIGFLIVDLEGKEGSYFVSASPRDDVAWFQWVSDDWLVFGVEDPNYQGRGAIGGGLMSMSRDGKTSRQLIARDWAKKADDVQRRLVLTPAYRFIRLGAKDSLEVMVSQSHWDANYEYDYSTLHALNVVNGQLRSIDTPKADTWLLDGNGVPRALERTLKGQITVSWFDPESKRWVERLTAPQREMPWVPIAARDERRLLVRTAYGQGYYQLREYDAAQDKLADKPMLTTPGFSSTIRPIYEKYSDKLLGLDVLVDGWTTTWFDPALKALQAKVDAKLQGRANDIDCSPCANAKHVLVHSYSDTDPGLTLLYTLATDQWQVIGKDRPDIPAERMARMELHRPKARDGEDLPVWITRSPTVPADKPAAAVVLVHGGPWTRGTYWGWHAQAQFLASRGYLVIEPEFRGSTGYGVEHYRKGFKQWGLTMQDDVSDALKFAVDKGWVDPKRVCVMGGSYGGYATLMGLAKNPDEFRCGIAFAAVSDQRYMFDFHWNDLSDEGKAYDLPELLGDRKADEARFAATSPVEQAARIKAPLLLVHGGEDRRVPIQNAERMRDALQKAGRPVEWVLYPRGYHGFPLLEDRLDFHRRVELFLDKNLR
jgi:acetyl esterase/lipase